MSWHGKRLGVGLSNSAKLSQIPYSIDNSLSVEEVFPEGKLDADLQQVDLRKTNSWRLKLGEINTIENGRSAIGECCCAFLYFAID